MKFFPVQMGCCRERERCRMCPPAPPLRTAGDLASLLEHEPDDVRVHFFGGPPPSLALLEACGDRIVHVRVRPDRLDRAEAERLRASGVHAIELDALTFHTPSLRAVKRRYPGPRVTTMIRDLKAMGFEVGVVLAIGLPQHDHAGSLADARMCLDADTVRLHPVLVLRDSGLWHTHLTELYEPLSLDQAITTVREMMDVLEPAGVRVIRVGQQPGPDELGRAVAGPAHPSMRELVEARRTLDHLRQLARQHEAKRALTIHCATADETRTRGPFNDNVRTLRAELRIQDVYVQADPDLERGTWILEAQ